MKAKKFIVISLVIILTLAVIPTAQATNMQVFSSYSDEAYYLKNMGIIDGTDRPYDIITRGEFVKALITASGLDDYAKFMEGSTIFSDMTMNDPLSGYVNAALDKNLMAGTSDRKFHAEGNVNLALMCTTMVRALGYKDTDLPGVWPKNYIYKAKSLSLLEGISLGTNDGVPRWAAAVMLSRLLDTNIKKANAGDSDKSYADASGLLKESYQLSLINNPVYSKPEVVMDFSSNDTKIGAIDIENNMKIVKDGQIIDRSQIEDNDVVYRVSDISGTKQYLLVVDNRIQGVISGITPKSIEIDGKSYTFGSYMNYGRLDLNEFKVGEYVTALIGYDGRVVDFFDIEHQDNGSFAFVVNYSSDAEGYNVKLLMVDGNTRTFKTDIYPAGYKGQLVNYSMVNDETVSLTSVSYNSSGTYNVQTSVRKIDDSYVSHNVKIFNLVSANVGTGDVVVNLINWSDLPSGTMDSGKILYMNEAGEFDDINVILTSGVLSGDYKIGLVKSVTAKTVSAPQYTADGKLVLDASGKPVNTLTVVGYNYSILIDGVEKSWSDSNIYIIASPGEFIKVEYLNNAIKSLLEAKYLAASVNILQVADVDRIKANDVTYYLSTKPVVYFKNSLGDYSLRSITDIDDNRTYSNVSIYLDKPLSSGGKVDAILVQQ